MLIFLFALTRIVLNFKNKRRQKRTDRINQLLNSIIENPDLLDNEMTAYFNQSIIEFILSYEKFERNNRGFREWQRINSIISNQVFKIQVKPLARSSYWLKRYLAVRSMQLGEHIEAENILVDLLNDKILLVSMNAAMVVLDNPTSTLINEMINVFSQEKQNLRLITMNILSSQPIKQDERIASIILKRLQREQNVYCKIVCYDFLVLLSPLGEIDPIVKKDLLTDNVNLKIAILKFIFHSDPSGCKQLLIDNLDNPQEEVRTIVVKLLGKTGDESMIPYIKSKLSDKTWWVRINSANALGSLGKEGILALQSISSQDDKFAYETAQAYLANVTVKREIL